MPYNENEDSDYFGEFGTTAPKPKRKDEIIPFDINIDYEKYEVTRVKRKVLGYVIKHD